VVVVDWDGDGSAAAGLVIRVVELRDIRVRERLCCCKPLVGVELQGTGQHMGKSCVSFALAHGVKPKL
jgi:hypothetical protein